MLHMMKKFYNNNVSGGTQMCTIVKGSDGVRVLSLTGSLELQQHMGQMQEYNTKKPSTDMRCRNRNYKYMESKYECK